MCLKILRERQFCVTPQACTAVLLKASIWDVTQCCQACGSEHLGSL